MKKTIYILIFCAFIFPSAFAEDDSANMHLVNTLYIMFRLPYTNAQLHQSDYQQKTIIYKGMNVTAFKCKASRWTAFFKILSSNDVPAEAVNNIKNAYKTSVIEQLLMYFDNMGEVIYFAKLKTKNNCFVLQIVPSGQMKIINCPIK